MNQKKYAKCVAKYFSSDARQQTDQVSFIDVDVVADSDGRAVACVEWQGAHEDDRQDDDHDDVGHDGVHHLVVIQIVQQLPHPLPDQRVRGDRNEDEEARCEEESQLK